MLQEEDKQLLVQISQLYYEQDFTQQQIAKKMNMSRSLVSKYLSRARKMGIVEITVHSETLHPYRDVEDRLKQIFGYQFIKITDPVQKQGQNEIAVETARYLAMRLSSCKYIAVSSSRTISEVAQKFSTPNTFSNVTFVPMSGGLGEERWKMDTNNVCATFAQRCGGKSISLHTPIIVDSYEAKEIIMQQYFIKTVLDKAKNANIALVGIGSSFHRFQLEEDYLQGLEDDELLDTEQVCGDMCYNYFDCKGKWIDCRWNRLIMGLSLEDIKKIPEVICVAADLEKAESIYIASKAGLINSLVTDINVAKRLLLLHSKNLYK